MKCHCSCRFKSSYVIDFLLIQTVKLKNEKERGRHGDVQCSKDTPFHNLAASASLLFLVVVYVISTTVWYVLTVLLSPLSLGPAWSKHTSLFSRTFFADPS